MRTIGVGFRLTGMLAAMLIMLSADVAAQPNDLCGRPTEKAAALFDRLAKSEKLPEIHRDKSYVALFDKARETTWTFTVAGHLAHPSAVCRHVVKDGDFLRIDMNIACSAPEAECEKLTDAFEELNQQMLKELEKQQKK